jgi:hypothetical protein
LRLHKKSKKRGGNFHGAEGESQNQPLGEGASLSHSPGLFGGEETLKIPNRCRKEFAYFYLSKKCQQVLKYSVSPNIPPWAMLVLYNVFIKIDLVEKGQL